MPSEGKPMSIAVKCPHCGLAGFADSTGVSLRCPGCKGEFRPVKIEKSNSRTASSFVREGLLKGEQIIYVAKLHWGVFVPVVLAALAGSVLLFVSVVLHDDATAPLAAFAVTVLLGNAVVAVLTVLRYLTTDFVVTNMRVLAKDGVISRRSIEIMLVKVESVLVNQSILGRLLGYGTICIGGTGGTKEVFPAIASPLALCRHLREQTRQSQ
jgi:hypothetical protein